MNTDTLIGWITALTIIFVFLSLGYVQMIVRKMNRERQRRQELAAYVSKLERASYARAAAGHVVPPYDEYRDGLRTDLGFRE